MKDNPQKQQWDTLIEVIQRSYQIKKHVDFFNWQQDYVTPIFPHDAMIAVWGDFSKGELQYDVCSKDTGIRTQALHNANENLNFFMYSLYKNWLANEKRWYKINDIFSMFDAKDLPNFFTSNLTHINSLMVYGVNDIRGNNDCIYIFLSKDKTFPIPNLLLGMLMPHLDAALRRIESFEVETDDHAEDYFSQGLTEREHEVLHWVKMGKSNTEISMILEISLNTVKNHLKRIFTKLDVSTRAHAVATYVQPKQVTHQL